MIINDLFINIPFAFFLIKVFLVPIVISYFDIH